LLQLVPWWRWPVAVYAAVVAAAAVVGAAATAVVARRSPRAAVLLAPAVTAAVLLGDQLAGAPLQLAAPFGDNPLVAGRFHGMGNIAYGVTMASLLLVDAVATADLPRRTRVAAVSAVGVVAVAVDGAPAWGDDIGGILGLVPAVAVLVALVAGVRVTVRRALTVAVAAVVVAVGVGLADYARPESQQTHAGRFVGDVLHGDAWRVVRRKLLAVLSSFTNPVVTLLVVAAVAVAVAAARGRVAAPSPVPGVGAAAVATAVLAVVGSLLNDSGVFVAAAALLAFLPPVVAARSDGAGLGDTGRL
jgi:hypothetical protein